MPYNLGIRSQRHHGTDPSAHRTKVTFVQLGLDMSRKFRAGWGSGAPTQPCTPPGGAMTPPRRPRGLFTDTTDGVYWSVDIDVLVGLPAAPRILVWTLLTPGAPCSPRLVLAALPSLLGLSGAV